MKRYSHQSYLRILLQAINARWCRPSTRLLFLIAFLPLANEPALVLASPPPSLNAKFFESHLRPLFKQHCSKCHSHVKQKGGLNLVSLETLLLGGDSGSLVIPGNADKSKLVDVLYAEGDPHMPPEGQLTKGEINMIRSWIDTPPNSPLNLKAQDIKNAEHRVSVRLPGNHSNLSLSHSINQYFQHNWQVAGIQDTGLADDRTFIRRVYLDLLGRIPSYQELQAFLFQAKPNKREGIVDKLLASEEFYHHFAQVLDLSLMGRPSNTNKERRKKYGWNDYLEQVLRKRVPWNEVVRSFIVARPEDDQPKGALWFLYEQKNDHQRMAERIAPLIYGTQVACAQCHDHPLADEIKQAHYWGLVAAFNRSKNVETKNGIGIAESAIGGFIDFTNLEKESQPAILTFLNGVTIDERPPAADAKEEDSAENYRIPPPEDTKAKPTEPATPIFSRREALAQAVTDNNPLLSKAIVNRLWAYFMGRGLVHPVDEINSDHPASHPELLRWLGEHFTATNYDLINFVRELTLSRPYQLAPRYQHRASMPVESFAFAVEKPLTAEVLLRSMLLATGQPLEEFRSDEPDRFRQLEEEFSRLFPDVFPVAYNATLNQASFLTNSPLIDQLLSPFPSSLIEQLQHCESDREAVRKAFLQIFGRHPDGQEEAIAAHYLNERASTPLKGLKQLVWALLTSAEFMINS